MNKVFRYILSVLIFSSCQGKYEFTPIEEFNIVENGLGDQEEVSVIYYSGGPFDNQVDHGFYRHAVVVSKSTNDTINVLTFPNSYLDKLSSSNYAYIYNDHPNVKKSIQTFDSLPDEMKEVIENMDTAKVSWQKYSFVARDPEFDHIANNNYITVIGSLTK